MWNVAKVSDLVVFLPEQTGIRLEEAKVRARLLREAGLLPSGGRGKGGADINATHCAHFLLSLLTADKAVNGPVAVRWFAELVPDSLTGDVFQLKPDVQSLLLAQSKPIRSAAASPVDEVFLMQDRSFVQAVATLIELARSEKGYETISSELVMLRCARGWPFAVLELWSAENAIVQQHYRRRSKEATKAPSHFTLQHHKLIDFPTPIFVEASIRAGIITSLAALLGPATSEYANFKAIPIETLLGTRQSLDSGCD
jgi:hypothetical protein